MGLPYGEEIIIVGRTMWTQSTSVTDRQTDRRTDRRTDRISITKTMQRRASHGKNGRPLMVKIRYTSSQWQSPQAQLALPCWSQAAKGISPELMNGLPVYKLCDKNCQRSVLAGATSQNSDPRMYHVGIMLTWILISKLGRIPLRAKCRVKKCIYRKATKSTFPIHGNALTLPSQASYRPPNTNMRWLRAWLKAGAAASLHKRPRARSTFHGVICYSVSVSKSVVSRMC